MIVTGYVRPVDDEVIDAIMLTISLERADADVIGSDYVSGLIHDHIAKCADQFGTVAALVVKRLRQMGYYSQKFDGGDFRRK